MTSSEFYPIHTKIRDAIRDNPEVREVSDMARIISTHIPESSLRAALEAALRSDIRTQFNQRVNISLKKIDLSSVKEAVLVGAPPKTESVYRGHSAKVQAMIRTSWEDFLDTHLSVGGKRVLLRNFTTDMLMSAAESRTVMAEKNAAEATKYTRLAEALRRSGKTTLGELTADEADL